MDFVIEGEFHEEHDELWSVFSSHHGCLVCMACIVKVVEDNTLLPLQKKPALSELSRLLTQQPLAVLQIFMHEERLVWHVLSILIGNLQARDDAYVALSIEATMKLMQQVKSEAVVACALDAIDEHVRTLMGNGIVLLPLVTLLGKMVQYLPALSQKLLTEYGDLLLSLSRLLGGSEEILQSSVAYIFIFLCETDYYQLMSTRLHQLLQEGLFHVLNTAQTEPLQINALGLLMKMIVDNEHCFSLMVLRKNNLSVLACLKRLLLNTASAVQIVVIQVLAQLLGKPESSQYATAILESDLTEFLFEGLHTQNTLQIESILKLLQLLAKKEKFYKRCHAVYGIESILHVLSNVRELKNSCILQESYKLLAEILERQPAGIPLFTNSALVGRCLCTIRYGAEHHQSQINDAACCALTAMVRKEHLMLPVPLTEIGALVTIVTTRHKHYLPDQKNLQIGRQKAKSQKTGRNEERLKNYVDLMVKVCMLAKQCKLEEISDESNFCCQSISDQETSLQMFVNIILKACDETCIPAVVVHWDYLQEEEMKKFLHLLCLLYDLHPLAALDIVEKLKRVGFLKSIIDTNASLRDAGFTEVCSEFLTLVVKTFYYEQHLPAECSQIILAADTLPWKFSQLSQVFAEMPVALASVEAYVHVLFLCFIQDCRVLSVSDLAVILTSAMERHTSLQELSPVCRKHFLFLYAWMITQFEANGDLILSPAVMENICLLLESPWEDWYTHDVALLQWCFSNDAIAAVAGGKMLEAYFSHISIEELHSQMEHCEEESEINKLLMLHHNRSFVYVLLESLTTQTIACVCKMLAVLEWSIQQRYWETDGRELNSPILQQITEVLQSVFLKNIGDHNIISLLKVMLLLMKETKCRDGTRPPVDVKILHHIMNRLTKTSELSPELDQAYMLYLLAAVSPSTSTESTVYALVIQNEGVMNHVQLCLDGDNDTLHCIACDILANLLQYKTIQSIRPVEVSVTVLVHSVCRNVGDIQVAGLSLLAALFGAGMQHGTVVVQERLTETRLRIFFVHLQQLMLQDGFEVQESATDCFGKMICFLHNTNSELADEMLSHPWNKLLIDVAMDTEKENYITNHLKLLTVVTASQRGCLLIRENSVLLNKIMAFSEHLLSDDAMEKKLVRKFLSKVVTNLANNLPLATIQRVKEYLAKSELE